jgi:hypothetical protein
MISLRTWTRKYLELVAEEPYTFFPGLALFAFAIVLLLLPDFSNDPRPSVAQRSLPIPQEGHQEELEEWLRGAAPASYFFLTGPLTTDAQLGDDLFCYKKQKLIALTRKAEMYAWKKYNGVKRTRFYAEWTEHPEQSTDNLFQSSPGHQNPPKKVDSLSHYAEKAFLGSMSFCPGKVTLPSLSVLPIELSPLGDPFFDATVTTSGFLYIPASANTTEHTPGIGDMRISYYGFPPQASCTLLAATIPLSYGQAPYRRLFIGTLEDVCKTLKTEQHHRLLLRKLIALFLFWLATVLMLQPLALTSPAPERFIWRKAWFLVGSLLTVWAVALYLLVNSMSYLISYFIS